jgi:predicted RNase H-like nuclease
MQRRGWRPAAVIFLGVDAAWGDINETGVAALDPTGVIVDAGWATGVNHTVAWISDHVEADTLVFIDAPLMVTNKTGQRSCEKQVAQRYWPWKVSAISTNLDSPRLGVSRYVKPLRKRVYGTTTGLTDRPNQDRCSAK